MNNSTYNKFGLGALLLTMIFFGYGAYTMATADGREPSGGRGLASLTGNNFTPIAAAAPSGKATKAEDIQLNKSNTVVFRAVVTPLSVAQAQQELLDKSSALSAGKPLYLVLDTPGGDINAGSQLIDTALGLGRPVHTVSSFAASMGFAFVQRLGKRYVTPSGTLMAHRARVEGIGGQIPGEAVTALNFIYTSVTRMEKQNAARLGITFEEYTALVKDEYWVTGSDAVAQNAADAVANIKCDDSLKGSNVVTYNTLFGAVDVTYSNCPAITAPLAVKAAAGADDLEIRKALTSSAALRRVLLGL